MAYRQFDLKRAAFVLAFAFDIDGATMGVNDFLRQRQTHTHAIA